MEPCRVHIFGASGAGVTTLGRALAQELGVPHHDVDDYYWQPTSPPYTTKRCVEDRLRLMREMFLSRPTWVLSGSLDSWGDPLLSHFDLVVFVRTPRDIRLARLRDREARHFGEDSIAPGGWRYREFEAFIDWASHYEDGSREGRNLKRHEAWAATLSVQLLQVDGACRTETLVAAILKALNR